MALTSPSKTVAKGDKGRLAAGISATATSLTISPIYKTVNGVRTKQGFNSTAGECEISQGDFTERISFEGLSVDATTKVTTLSTVTRGLPVTNTTANFTGGTGKAWPKGAYIAVVDAASYNQSAVYENTNNAFTGTNSFAATSTFNAPVVVAGTTSYVKLPSMTEAQRDALSASNGMQVYVTDGSNANRIHTYEGGAWGVSSSTTVADASTTVAGKVEEATAAELGAGTAAGGTSARLFINPSLAVKTSSGAGDENKIPVLDSSGKLATGFIPSGTKTNLCVYSSGTSSATLTNPTAATPYTLFDTHTFAIPANTLTADTGYEFELFVNMDCGSGSSSSLFAVRCGTSVMASTSITNGADGDGHFAIKGFLIGTAAAGASVPVKCMFSLGSINDKSASAYNSVSVATNGSLTLQFACQFNASDAGNAATIRMCKITKISATPF